jgi:acyl-coenzyme A thioesterase PaaI-like protein
VPDGQDLNGAAEPERADAQRTLVEQIRALSAAALLTTEGNGPLALAFSLVEEATRLLDGAQRSSRYEGTPGLLPGITEENDPVWETHAAFGASNPLAPPIIAIDHPGRVEGTLTFSRSYEGGPGTVYGGFIAAAFDGMLGRAVISSGQLGVTRSLTVRYLRPTPLSTSLRIEAEVVSGEGRDIEVTGRLWAVGRITCEAEAVFVRVDDGRYQLREPPISDSGRERS